MNLNRITFEHFLFAAALILALLIRFANLGSAPLSDSEASYALQALALAHGGSSVATGSIDAGNVTVATFAGVIGPQPAYVVLTGLLFAIFGSSNFLARFWPALAGGLIILVPFLISRPNKPHLLESAAAVIMAFGLALAPGLVASSRLAGGPMMAVSFFLLALGFLYATAEDKRIQPLLAGLAAGLALLSGPAIVSGLIILALSLAAAKLLARLQRPSTPEEIDPPTVTDHALAPNWLNSTGIRYFGGAMAVTILLIGTCFFRYPQELAAWFETLSAYLQGWAMSAGVPALRMVAALLFYQPVAIVFGLVGAIRGLFFITRPRDKLLVQVSLAWSVIALLVVLVYPSRQTADLAWVIPPIWFLAALDLQHYLPEGKVNPISVVHAMLLMLLMGLLWYSLASISAIGSTTGSQSVETEKMARIIVMVGIVALGALTTVLIQLGWSWEVSRLGLAWGILAGLILFAVSMLWGTAYLRANQPQELWAPTPLTDEADLFASTLHDLSSWNTGRPDSIDIVSEVSAPSIRWMLRNFYKTRYVESFPSNELPSILITRLDQESPTLTASYRGQDFSWWVNPAWSGALPPDLTGWLTFRRAPVQQEKIILWARSDRFPGGTLALPPSSEPRPAPDTDLLDQP
jgi:predicted membrane-bound mannosyltransferase